jgi:hypothetical protein
MRELFGGALVIFIHSLTHSSAIPAIARRMPSIQESIGNDLIARMNGFHSRRLPFAAQRRTRRIHREQSMFVLPFSA